MEQLSIFDALYEKYKIKKPIRLIELFAGYGSQALALKYLGANFEHWKICEWAIPSIIAYADVHKNELPLSDIDFSKPLTKNEIAEYLFNKGVSANYNTPATFEQLKRMPEDKLRLVYNSIQCTHNLVDISRVNGKNLEINDVDKYEYILTYSFPCQDLSLAGTCAGMKKGTGTRSGLLWEVERILKECEVKPQILLMENVTQVHGVGNDEHFKAWQLELEKMGYSNYWQDLSATEFGCPQTRVRTFMISILGNYNYTFPKKIPLKLRLKDLLEPKVDEKYYLSERMINYVTKNNDKWTGNNDKSLINKQIASTINTGEGNRRCDASNYVSDLLPDEYDIKSLKIKNATKKGYLEATDRDVVVDTLKKDLCNKLIQDGLVEEGDIVKHSYTQQILDGNKKCVEKNDGNMITLTTRGDCVGTTVKDEIGNLRIRKLTPKECFRLMGLKDEDITKIMEHQTNASSYHLAGDSIVTTCLMAIFGELLDIDWKEKIEEKGWWNNGR